MNWCLEIRLGSQRHHRAGDQSDLSFQSLVKRHYTRRICVRSNHFGELAVSSHAVGEVELLCPGKSHNRVRREKVMVHSGSNPPGNWFAPPVATEAAAEATKLLKPLV
jgi:hypothetical protein